MTTATRPRVEELLDRLAYKTLSFGQRVLVPKEYDNNELIFLSKDEYMISGKLEKTINVLSADGSSFEFYGDQLDGFKILGHPITADRVAKLIARDYRDSEFENEKELKTHCFQYSQVPEILALWSACEQEHQNKSLQEIVKESGWREVNPDEFDQLNAECHGCELPNIEVLKNPNAQKLFENLISVFETQRK